MKKSRSVFMSLMVFSVLLAVCFIGSAGAGIPQTVNFQGFLTDTEDTAAPDGSYTLTFSIWNKENPDAEDAEKLWEEVHESVPVKGGVYSVALGSIVPFSDPDGDAETADGLGFSSPYFLGVSVNEDGMMIMDGKLPAFSASPAAFRSATSGGRLVTVLENTEEEADEHQVGEEEDVLLASGNMNILLPPASGAPNRIITIKKTDGEGGAVTVLPHVVKDEEGEILEKETVDGAESIVLGAEGQTLTIISDASSWHSLAGAGEAKVIAYGSVTSDKLNGLDSPGNEGQVPVSDGNGGFAWSDDKDSLNGLECASGQVPKWNEWEKRWICGNDAYGSGGGNTDLLASLNCADGQIAKRSGNAWVCGDDIDTDTTIPDTDTLAALNCADGQVTKWNNAAGAWECANDADNGTGTDSDTLGSLTTCTNEQVAKWNGTAWVCGDDLDTDTTIPNTDTLASLTCVDGQVVKWNNTNGAWECRDDIDTTISDTDTLASLTCADGQVAKWNNTNGAWECQDDAGATITESDPTVLASVKDGVDFSELTGGTGIYFSYAPDGTVCGDTQVLKWDNTNNQWVCGDDAINTDASNITTGTLDDARLSGDVAHLSIAETITADWINTANPWADNEVADNLTISGGKIVGSTIDSTPIGTSSQAPGAFSSLRVGTVATAGNVLTADASGNATWQALSVTETDPQVDVITANEWCLGNTGGTAIDCNPIVDGTLLSFASVNASGTAEGLILPQSTDVSPATAEGQLSWDSDDDTLYVGDGTAAIAIGGGEFIRTDPGTGVYAVHNSTDTANDDFVFGASALGGTGSRMFFDKDNAAFRAGSTLSDHWDAVNVGQYSSAMGYNTIASGVSSTAMGANNTASGSASTVMGAGNTASEVYSTAMGQSTTASAHASTAMGGFTTASGDGATAMGFQTTASGYRSTAMGIFTTASGDGATAMGSYTTAESFVETAIGAYDTDYTPIGTNAWNAADRLFVIGNGTGVGSESDALIVYKNGDATLKGQLTLTNGTDSYTLPNKDGTANQVLATDGAGTVIWQGITEDFFVSNLTFDSGDVINLSGAGTASGNGLILPQAADVTTATSAGQLSWDSDDSKLYVGTGAGVVEIGGGEFVRTDPGTGVFAVHNSTDTAADDFVFGASTLNGTGSRMFFDKDKAAFRAGATTTNQWNTPNVGQYSTAMGFNPIAAGDYSMALGRFARASGMNSTAIGPVARAIGDASMAMGSLTTASGAGSTAIGSSTTAEGNSSMAMGQLTTASGGASTAMGFRTTASGFMATAMGRNTTASGEYSTAMGAYTTAESYAETVIGAFDTNYTPNSLSAWNAADRLFVIGNGTGIGSESDALIVYKNGDATLAGTLTQLSDRSAKENFEAVYTREVLTALMNVPIETWNYKNREESDRHIGPMAQDFHAAFGLGKDDKGIATVDADGVALAAIQGLYELVQEQKAEIENLKARIETLENAK